VSSSEPTTHAQTTGRIVFLDGMRGIASLAVVVFHVLRPALDEVSKTAGGLAEYGFHGVTLFFVISGFAISQSLAGSWIAPQTAGRFLLRRVVRLDPPYWASIALVLVVSHVARLALHQPNGVPTDLKLVLANIFYVQYFLRMPGISDVYWTLAFEIQFYVLLVVLWAVQQRLEKRLSERSAFALTFVGPLGYSLLVMRGWAPSVPGACSAWWYVFFVGVAAQRLVARHDLPSFAVTLCLVALAAGSGSTAWTALGFALLIALGDRRHKLRLWLSGRTWQLLGRISYSLYLTHWVVGGRLTNLLNHFSPSSPLARLGTALVGLVVSILFAYMFWWTIERPSLALSRTIGVRDKPRSPLSVENSPVSAA
jgi:peptidoglycan/LPS O-acetylase OafA/YrhL